MINASCLLHPVIIMTWHNKRRKESTVVYTGWCEGLQRQAVCVACVGSPAVFYRCVCSLARARSTAYHCVCVTRRFHTLRPQLCRQHRVKNQYDVSLPLTTKEENYVTSNVTSSRYCYVCTNFLTPLTSSDLQSSLFIHLQTFHLSLHSAFLLSI
jgi:hypothetical protein